VAFLLPLTRAVGLFLVLPIEWNLHSSRGRLACRTGRRPRRPEGGTELKVARISNQRPPGENLAAASSRVLLINWPIELPPLREVALLLAPPLGLAVYFALMYTWTGNAFEGMQAQKYWGVHSISNLWNVPKFLLGLFQPTRWHEFSGSALDRLAFLLLLYSLPLVWKLGKDMLVWTYVLGILPAMSGTFVSFTRFESTAFPVFLALAAFFVRMKRKWPQLVFLAICAGLHGLLLLRFVNFRWAG
jgi:hypothetical protein